MKVALVVGAVVLAILVALVVLIVIVIASGHKDASRSGGVSFTKNNDT